jgi:hypothetical protein
MSFDAIEEVMVTTALCCILVAIDEKGEVAVGLGGGHMLDQHWRESSEDCDEASNMNLNEDSGLVGIEEYRVDYPMNVGDASSLRSFTSRHASLVPMVQDEQKMVMGAT